MSITRSIVQGSGLRPFLFIIYILDLRPLSGVNVMCKYADDVSQLCPQYTDTTLEEEYIHIQKWADWNKLLIDTSKTKEIMFKRLSLRQYVPPSPITHIKQVDYVKLLGILFTSTVITSIHINSVFPVMNQRLYLLNQLRTRARYPWSHTNIHRPSCCTLSLCSACHCWSDLSEWPP